MLYSQLLQWLDRSGMRMSGPLREVYHRYGADQVGYRPRSRRAGNFRHPWRSQ